MIGRGSKIRLYSGHLETGRSGFLLRKLGAGDQQHCFACVNQVVHMSGQIYRSGQSHQNLHRATDIPDEIISPPLSSPR